MKLSENRFDKYLNATSSLDEEAELFDESVMKPDSRHVWFRLVSKHRKSSPQNLEAEIWDHIQRSEKIRQINYKRVVPIAATIILFISLSISFKPWSNSSMSLQEKENKLNEVIQLFDDHESRANDPLILYEDESIIIYLN